MVPYNPSFHLKSEFAGEVEGRQVYKPIVPQAGEGDPIPTHYAWFGQGGYKVCYSYEEMYNIPFAHLSIGCFAHSGGYSGLYCSSLCLLWLLFLPVGSCFQDQ